MHQLRRPKQVKTRMAIACSLLGLAWAAVVTLPAQAAPTAATDLAWLHQKHAAEWTAQVTQAVEGTVLSRSVPIDISDFCPRYPKLTVSDRTHFWAGLLSAMTRLESRFDPTQSFTEPFRESGPDSPFEVSRGLLQLSFPGDRDRYQCKLARAEDLYDPQTNLACGANILSALVTRDHRVAGRESTGWKGAAAYWSVLRERGGKNNSNAKSLAWIKQFTQSLAVCRVR